ncbi:MAG: hypothetical protein KGL51_07745 [Betaproteobacteria bacterium]|nr:hypothetical protein [Betaproteobacteria bacterium]MDE2124773.1 hypothetical protein [Betaproteobacteria bacterium]MDE2185800.1 hypothetical protein [Betaproteobacteria bacterium]MDE2324545.1 hypothetical protein [Betaproteobacteria bacterium]
MATDHHTERTVVAHAHEVHQQKIDRIAHTFARKSRGSSFDSCAVERGAERENRTAMAFQKIGDDLPLVQEQP